MTTCRAGSRCPFMRDSISPLQSSLPLIGRRRPFKPRDAPGSCQSEHIDGRETRLFGDAVPEVNRKADVAGPKRIPSPANDQLSAAILNDGRHRELAGAVEPNRIVGAA